MRVIIGYDADNDDCLVLSTGTATLKHQTRAEIQSDSSRAAVLGYDFNKDIIEVSSVASCIQREVFMRRMVGVPVAFLGSWYCGNGFYAVLGDTQKQGDISPFVRVLTWSDFLQLCAMRTPLTNVIYDDTSAYVSNELLCNQMRVDTTKLLCKRGNDLVCMDIDTPFEILPTFVATNIGNKMKGVVVKPSDIVCKVQEKQTDADYLTEGYLLVYQPDSIDNADELRASLLGIGDYLYGNSIGYALHTYDVTVNSGLFKGNRPENRIEAWFTSYNTEYAATDKNNVTQIVECAKGYEGDLVVALELQKQFVDCINVLRDELF